LPAFEAPFFTRPPKYTHCPAEHFYNSPALMAGLTGVVLLLKQNYFLVHSAILAVCPTHRLLPSTAFTQLCDGTSTNSLTEHISQALGNGLA
jgi:hypothetical protein